MTQSSEANKHHRVPDSLKLLYSAQEIQARVSELGAEVSRWCRAVREDSGKDVVAIPVLRGAIFFFADLTRAIDTSVEIAPVRASSYNNTQINSQSSSVSIIADALDVRGRTVLVVDDVCDSGRTLEELERALIERGAREVRSAVLVRRLLQVPSFVPCWVGYEYAGEEWFVGYGLEMQERWRNLPNVYTLKPER
ncbi:MAG: phosphoribosyltransferase [Pseudomonadota bacterium]